MLGKVKNKDNKVEYSDFIVYVDESGSVDMLNNDPDFPVFVLSFCVFHKRYYTDTVVKSVEQLKFKHFGHDIIILHERDIRKRTSHFAGLDRIRMESLMSDLNGLMSDNNFILISSVIRKDKLIKRDANPYEVAMKFCLERLYFFLREKNQNSRLTHIVVESRGKNEDSQLELGFRRICDPSGNYHKKTLPFEIIFASKKTNSSGLQFADLVARPIGRHVINPSQSNRAFDILKAKFYCKGGRGAVGSNYNGYGLKIYP
ncbi:DUF3800 domain-containing protein [Acinetobacter sp. ESBL14]|uniref:DUF3800 domain-containing protein n=1 Tax=Acinetobacter sp. ESBL14 TaxID=3077329 RepID=UPI002FC8FA3C